MLPRRCLCAEEGVDRNGGVMRGGTELMSEGMYRALESLVGLIVEWR